MDLKNDFSVLVGGGGLAVIFLDTHALAVRRSGSTWKASQENCGSSVSRGCFRLDLTS